MFKFFDSIVVVCGALPEVVCVKIFMVWLKIWSQHQPFNERIVLPARASRPGLEDENMCAAVLYGCFVGNGLEERRIDKFFSLNLDRVSRNPRD